MRIVIFTALALFLCIDTARALSPTVDLRISFDLDQRTLTGAARITVPPDRDTEIFLTGLDVGRLTVDGEEQAEPGDSLALAAAPVTREITVSWTLASGDADSGNMITREGIVLLGSWHPVPDRDAVYSLEAEVPAAFTAVAEGDTVGIEDTAAGRRFSFAITQPLAGVHFIAGPYDAQQVSFSNTSTLQTLFFPEDRQIADHYRQKALAALARYGKRLGDFPYQRFSIVENLLPTGYAMPTFTLLGRSVVRLPFIVDTSLVHEIVHQWFGNAVDVAPAGGNWAEGLATYLADHARAEQEGEGHVWRKEQLVRYASYVNENSARSLREFRGAGLDPSLEVRASRAIGYDKGAMVFHMLRNTVGETNFEAGLRDFYQRMRFKRASWEDIRTSFEEVSHTSLADFFSQWLTRSDIPELAVERLRVVHEDGLPVVTFTLRQKTESPYRLVVPVSFFRGDEEIRKIVQTDALEKKVAIPLDQVPEYLVIDPRYDLMRRLPASELPPVWSRFAGAPAKLAVLAADAPAGVFQPFVDMLTELGCAVRNEKEVTDSDVAAGSVLFLGARGALARTLFADAGHPATGVTVDVRRNPLDPQHVAVLVSAADAGEAQAAAAKLRHYGKYSYLHFEAGRIKEKRTTARARGMVYRVDEPPPGMAVSVADPFETVVDRISANRVVYVGESHTAMEDHHLQLRIIKALYARQHALAIGMEMFSRAAQPALDDYIAGRIDEKEFLKKSKYFRQWGYDYRYYRDILRYARRHRIPVIGLNVEKATASKVFKGGGLAALTEEELAGLPPDRDLDVPGYQERIAAIYSMHGRHGNSGGGFKDFFQAQGLWDETMAATVVAWLRANPQQQVVVLAGRGHVIRDTGIPPRVARRLDVRQAVVVNVAGNDIDGRRIDYAFFSPPEQLPPAPILGVQLVDGENGVRIVGLSARGPAGKAGIRKDDVLVALNGEAVPTVNDVKIFMLDRGKGEKIVVTVRRDFLFGDRLLDIELTL